MTLMMKTCFFSLAFLFLWQVQDGAEACTCVNIPPEQVFCRADVVFSARVTGQLMVTDLSGNVLIKVDVQVDAMYKGSLKIDSVYTPTPGACGVTLETTGQNYILTGQMGADGAVHITMCDFHVPLNEMTDDQKTALNSCKNSSCVC